MLLRVVFDSQFEFSRKANMRLCVIGAGTAGLTSIKQGLSFGCEVIAFEQSDRIGGTWVYDENIGKNKYGLDVHTSMYAGLHTNLPKEVMGAPDFPIPSQDKSYISAEDMLKFLNLYADNFKVRDHIRFEHHVIRVHPLEGGTWEVIVKNLKSNNYETHYFDGVLVCNGHYHTPAIPKYEGGENFKGKQIHSHNFRRSDTFQDESVLIIGGR
jgi:dimethylaniline monooxygenase (N-oxide forming)